MGTLRGKLGGEIAPHEVKSSKDLFGSTIKQ